MNMSIEALKCSSCGAPLQIKSSQDLVICEHCSTPNKIIRETKNGMINYQSQSLDLIAEEVILSKSKRQIDTLNERKLNSVREKESLLSTKKRKWNHEKKAEENKPYDALGLLLGVSGLLIWLATIILVFSGNFIALPVGIILGVVLIKLGSSRREKQLAPFLAKIDNEYEKDIGETRKAYDDEINRLETELNELKSTVDNITVDFDFPGTSNNFNSRYNLILVNAGAKKIETIKVILKVAELGLPEAKELAETPNNIILKNASKSIVAQAHSLFVEVGATVNVDEN